MWTNRLVYCWMLCTPNNSLTAAPSQAHRSGFQFESCVCDSQRESWLEWLIAASRMCWSGRTKLLALHKEAGSVPWGSHHVKKNEINSNLSIIIPRMPKWLQTSILPATHQFPQPQKDERMQAARLKDWNISRPIECKQYGSDSKHICNI